MARKIRFEFVGDTSQLQGSLDQVQQDSDKLGGSFDDTFNKKGAGGALAMGKQFVKAHPALMAMVAASAALGVALVKASQATIDFAARADVIAKKARALLVLARCRVRHQPDMGHVSCCRWRPGHHAKVGRLQRRRSSAPLAVVCRSKDLPVRSKFETCLLVELEQRVRLPEQRDS